MLVVDRREDESAYPRGSNRSETDRSTLHDSIREPTTIPAQVEIELDLSAHSIPAGVYCVTHTPGPDVLLRLLLNRVWGVEKQIDGIDC